MSAQPVDVLAVLDALPELLLLADSNPADERLRGIAPKVREARAAVAELIEAAKVMDARFRNGGTTPEWSTDLARFRAALARVQP